MKGQIEGLVDRGLELRARIAEAEEELSVIEEKLKAAALLGEQVPLVDAERDGRQYLARGSEMVVPVVLTADIITASFQDGSPLHARLADAAGDRLGLFYRQVKQWKLLAKSGKAFRLEAAGVLGDGAPAFVSAAVAKDRNGIPRSQTKVEWDRAEEAK